MRRRTLIGVLTLIGVGVFLGTTVFREEIAQAAQSIIVTNTPDQAVPAREQNLDANGFIRVHEQGSAPVKLDRDGNVVRVATSRSSPVDVDEVDTPRSEPFQAGQSSGSVSYTVPAGREAVLEYVSAGFCPGQSLLGIRIVTTVGGVDVTHFLPALAPANFGVAGGPVHIYADPGTPIVAFPIGASNCGVSVSGHLEGQA
jgi:hypothetical protein